VDFAFLAGFFEMRHRAFLAEIGAVLAETVAFLATLGQTFFNSILPRASEKGESDGGFTGRINSRALRPAPRRWPARFGTGSRELGGQIGIGAKFGIGAKGHDEEDVGREAVDVMRFRLAKLSSMYVPAGPCQASPPLARFLM
jgi:hypothetical protein